MRPVLLAASLVAVIGFPATTRAWDGKAVSPGAACVAYAPDTTAAELQFTTTGIYNPGTTTEKVMCSLPRDVEYPYGETNTLNVVSYYRVLGGAPGRLSCTLFMGTSTQQSGAVATVTGNGDLKSGGARGSVTLNAATQDGGFTFTPVSLLCTISPKTSFGAIVVTEAQSTDVDIGMP
jgi:hypothetical protein